MNTTTSPTDINIHKIGIVARDYNITFPNGYRDYSHVWAEVLALLDNEGCDAVLFSLYTLIPRLDFDPAAAVQCLKVAKLVCIEEYIDTPPDGRNAGECVVYCRERLDWREYRVKQAFGRINTPAMMKKAQGFAENELPKRIFGNCALIVCGEVNTGRYNKRVARLAGGYKRLGVDSVNDIFGVRAALPPETQIILNAGHDRTSRFEMPLKRRFFSEGRRLVVTVWNKGKRDIHGKIKDGFGPAWSAYFDGEAVPVTALPNDLGVDIGILTLGEASHD